MIWDRYEAAILRFGRSKWSTVLLLAYSVVWLGWCWWAKEAPGFDGIITIILGEIALATLRRK